MPSLHAQGGTMVFTVTETSAGSGVWNWNLSINYQSGGTPNKGVGRVIVRQQTVPIGTNTATATDSSPTPVSIVDQSYAFPGQTGITTHSGTVSGIGYHRLSASYWVHVNDDNGASSSWNHSGWKGAWIVMTAGPANTQISFEIPANTGPNEVIWSIVKVANGKSQASQSQPPGAPATVLTIINQAPGATKDDFVLKYWLPSLKFDTEGGMWIQVAATPWVEAGDIPLPTAETVFTAVSTPKAENIVPTGTAVTPSNTVPTTAPTQVPNVAVKPPGTGGAVWNAGGGGSGLTDTVFKEGVDKIVNGQVAQTTHLGTLAGVAGDISGAKGSGETATAGMGDGGAGAKSAAEAAVGRQTKTFLSADGLGGAGTLMISAPKYGFEINLDPMAGSAGTLMANMVRAAIAWIAVVCFEWWLWKEFQSLYFAAATFPQAKGNPIIGGTGAQATALTAAVLITGILVSVPGIFWALADSGLTVDVSQPLPSAIGAPDGGSYLFRVFVPTGTLATVLTQVFFVRKGGLVMVSGIQALIRFVVP